MSDHDFREKLNNSEERIQKDLDILYCCYPDVFYCAPYLVDKNDQGVDYIVVMKDKSVRYVDAKHREAGVGKHWKTTVVNGVATKVPELTLEVMSAKEANVPGWILDEGKLTDDVLFTFNEEDSPNAYLFELRILREILIANLDKWIDKYGLKECTSNGGKYTTTSVYVPVPEVLKEYDKLTHRNIIIRGGNTI